MKKEKFFYELVTVKKSGSNDKPDIYNNPNIAMQKYEEAKQNEDVKYVTVYKCKFTDYKLERVSVFAQWKPLQQINEKELAFECTLLKEYFTVNQFNRFNVHGIQINMNFDFKGIYKHIHKAENNKPAYSYSLIPCIDRIGINLNGFIVYLNDGEDREDYVFPDEICGETLQVRTMSDWNQL